MAKHFWQGSVMDATKVAQKWGTENLDVSKFKNGSEEQRAKFAYSLLQNEKKYIGKDVRQIRSELGDPDGFYFKDVFPAYIIQSAKTKKEEAWQIVFLLDRKRTVESVIVHKSCCDL
jgi:hypothetical protein